VREAVSWRASHAEGHFREPGQERHFGHPADIEGRSVVSNRVRSKEGPLLETAILSKTKFTDEEAVDVGLRSWSGQYQHQIAAAYEINVRGQSCAEGKDASLKQAHRSFEAFCVNG
jgi:hypothetical protein